MLGDELVQLATRDWFRVYAAQLDWLKMRYGPDLAMLRDVNP
jgi:hypothetical protein